MYEPNQIREEYKISPFRYLAGKLPDNLISLFGKGNEPFILKATSPRDAFILLVTKYAPEQGIRDGRVILEYMATANGDWLMKFSDGRPPLKVDRPFAGTEAALEYERVFSLLRKELGQEESELLRAGAFFNADTVIRFGKYRNSRLEEVIHNDFHYIEWAADKIDGFAGTILKPEHTV